MNSQELSMFPSVSLACVALLYSPDLPIYLCGLDLFASFISKIDLTQPYFTMVAAASGPRGIMAEFEGVRLLVLRALYTKANVSDTFYLLAIQLLARFCQGPDMASTFGCAHPVITIAALLPWLICKTPKAGALAEPDHRSSSMQSFGSISSSRPLVPGTVKGRSYPTYIALLLAEAATSNGWYLLVRIHNVNIGCAVGGGWGGGEVRLRARSGHHRKVTSSPSRHPRTIPPLEEDA